MTIPAGYGQATWVFSGTAAPTGAVVSLGFADTGSGLTPTQIADIFKGQWEFGIMPLLVAQLALDKVEVKIGPDATGPMAEVSSSAVGGLAEAGMAPNTTYLIRKVTADGGRAGRGRMYLPGVSEQQVNENGVIQPAQQGDLQDAFDAMLIALAAADLPPVVLHGPASPLILPSVITSFVVDGTVATQRRRLRR